MADVTTGQWRTWEVDGVEWKSHWQHEASGKFIVTIYGPGLEPVLVQGAHGRYHVDALATVGRLVAKGETLYWRGESFISWDEARDNCIEALREWTRQSTVPLDPAVESGEEGQWTGLPSPEP